MRHNGEGILAAWFETWTLVGFIDIVARLIFLFGGFYCFWQAYKGIQTSHPELIEPLWFLVMTLLLWSTNDK